MVIHAKTALFLSIEGLEPPCPGNRNKLLHQIVRLGHHALQDRGVGQRGGRSAWRGRPRPRTGSTNQLADGARAASGVPRPNARDTIAASSWRGMNDA